MIFCDSSFLIALLVKKDYFHRSATSHAAGFTESIPFTLPPPCFRARTHFAHSISASGIWPKRRA